eukprot:gene11927-13162_t
MYASVNPAMPHIIPQQEAQSVYNNSTRIYQHNNPLVDSARNSAASYRHQENINMRYLSGYSTRNDVMVDSSSVNYPAQIDHFQQHPHQQAGGGVPTLAVGGHNNHRHHLPPPPLRNNDTNNCSNYYNLTTTPSSRNRLVSGSAVGAVNSVANGHEYYFSSQNMDHRHRNQSSNSSRVEAFAYQQQNTDLQGHVNNSSTSSSRRSSCLEGNSDILTPSSSTSLSNSSVGDRSRKGSKSSWAEVMFPWMDRQAESILDLSNEDALELERIAATIKQDCRSPNSMDTLLPNDFTPMSLPYVGASNDISYSRWNGPTQFYDPITPTTSAQRRKQRSSRSTDAHYFPDDLILSNVLQTFNLDSTSGQLNYSRFGDTGMLPNQAGHFNTNPSLVGYPPRGVSSYQQHEQQQQHSFLNDLQTFHGASLNTAGRQSFGSDNMRTGSGDIMLSETSRGMYYNKSIATVGTTNTISGSSVASGKERRQSNNAKHNHNISISAMDATDDVFRQYEAGWLRRDYHHSMNRTTNKRNDYNTERLHSRLMDRMNTEVDDSNHIHRSHNSHQHKGGHSLAKRKSEYAEDHDFQSKKPKYYFEQEEHYVVHKLLRELSSMSMPENLPKTTSASLFYRLLSSKTEPRVMQTLSSSIAVSSSSRSHKKVIVKDDVPEDEIGKYSKIGSHPFVYIHGASSRASPTKSVKLIELLTTKQKEEPSPTENEDNQSKTNEAIDCSGNTAKSTAEEEEKQKEDSGNETGIDAAIR